MTFSGKSKSGGSLQILLFTVKHIFSPSNRRFEVWKEGCSGRRLRNDCGSEMGGFGFSVLTSQYLPFPLVVDLCPVVVQIEDMANIQISITPLHAHSYNGKTCRKHYSASTGSFTPVNHFFPLLHRLSRDSNAGLFGFLIRLTLITFLVDLLQNFMSNFILLSLVEKLWKSAVHMLHKNHQKCIIIWRLSLHFQTHNNKAQTSICTHAQAEFWKLCITCTK